MKVFVYVFSGTITAFITYFVAICSFLHVQYQLEVIVGYLPSGQISVLVLKYPYLPPNLTSGICAVVAKKICQSTKKDGASNRISIKLTRFKILEESLYNLKRKNQFQCMRRIEQEFSFKYQRLGQIIQTLPNVIVQNSKQKQLQVEKRQHS